MHNFVSIFFHSTTFGYPSFLLCESTVILFLSSKDFIVRICYNVLISSTVDKHLGCLQFGTVVNKISMNIPVQIVLLHIFTFPE